MNRQTAKATALYTRLSRDDELIGESSSIKNQRAMMETYTASGDNKKGGNINYITENPNSKRGRLTRLYVNSEAEKR